MADFPDGLVPLHLELFINGAWLPMQATPTAVGDVYRDVYTDVYEGTLAWNDGRLYDNAPLVISHGRTDEADQVDSCSVTFELDNRDGWLTPDDPRSPWWPQIKQGLPCRIYVGTDPANDSRFYGEVSSIVPIWPEGDLSADGIDLLNLAGENPADLGEARVVVTASGVLRRLRAGAKPLRSPIHRWVTSPTYLSRVVDYWPMEDGPDTGGAATGLPSSKSLRHGDLERMSTIGFTVASDDGLGGSEPLPNVGGRSDAAWSARLSSAVATLDAGWAIDLHLHIPEGPAASDESIKWDVNCVGGHHVKWTMTIGFDGSVPFVRLRSYASSGAILVDTLTTNPTQMFGEHFITLRLAVRQVGGDIAWSIIWAPITPGVDTQEGGGSTSLGTCGHPVFTRMEIGHAPPQGMSVGHVIVHDGIEAGWLVGPDCGFVGEPSGDRFVRLCTEESIPRQLQLGPAGSGLENTDTTIKMGRQRALPLHLLLQECTDADGGILCELLTVFGARFRGRGSRFNQAPKMTLSAASQGIAGSLEPASDDQTLRNDVTVNIPDGGKYRAVDPITSQPPPVGFGVYDEQVNRVLDTLHHARDHAGWRLHLGTWREMRYPEITIDFAQRPDLIDDWKTVRVGDVIRLDDLPPQAPMAALDLIGQGWIETLSRAIWTATLNCTPAGPWDVAIWGTARWYPKTSYLTAPISAGATSFQITTPGIKWTTDPAHFPFPVRIGPELVTCTDIDAASGDQQLMTVTRNVNLLGRAHAPGTAVKPSVDSILFL